MKDIEREDIAWAWVTASRVLSKKPCDLLSAHLIVSAANASITLYDGENTRGDIIITMQSPNKTVTPFKPNYPTPLKHGLYVSVGSNVTGVFVQWRVLK